MKENNVKLTQDQAVGLLDSIYAQTPQALGHDARLFGYVELTLQEGYVVPSRIEELKAEIRFLVWHCLNRLKYKCAKNLDPVRPIDVVMSNRSDDRWYLESHLVDELKIPVEAHLVVDLNSLSQKLSTVESLNHLFYFEYTFKSKDKNGHYNMTTVTHFEEELTRLLTGTPHKD